MIAFINRKRLLLIITASCIIIFGIIKLCIYIFNKTKEIEQPDSNIKVSYNHKKKKIGKKPAYYRNESVSLPPFDYKNENSYSDLFDYNNNNNNKKYSYSFDYNNNNKNYLDSIDYYNNKKYSDSIDYYNNKKYSDSIDYYNNKNYSDLFDYNNNNKNYSDSIDYYNNKNYSDSIDYYNNKNYSDSIDYYNNKNTNSSKFDCNNKNIKINSNNCKKDKLIISDHNKEKRKIKPDDHKNNKFIVKPLEKPIEKPIEKPLEKPIEKPLEKPVENPLENPLEKPVENPLENPLEKPFENPLENPLENSLEKPVEKLLEKPVKLESNGYTCYFNALLQFLLSLSEFQNLGNIVYNDNNKTFASRLYNFIGEIIKKEQVDFNFIENFIFENKLVSSKREDKKYEDLVEVFENLFKLLINENVEFADKFIVKTYPNNELSKFIIMLLKRSNFNRILDLGDKEIHDLKKEEDLSSLEKELLNNDNDKILKHGSKYIILQFYQCYVFKTFTYEAFQDPNYVIFKINNINKRYVIKSMVLYNSFLAKKDYLNEKVATSGHYITLSNINNNWYICNDSRIVKTNYDKNLFSENDKIKKFGSDFYPCLILFQEYQNSN